MMQAKQAAGRDRAKRGRQEYRAMSHSNAHAWTLYMSPKSSFMSVPGFQVRDKIGTRIGTEQRGTAQYSELQARRRRSQKPQKLSFHCFCRT